MALKPVHALVGNDLFLQLEKLFELQRAAGKEAQRMDVDGETAQLGEVLDELRSFAMFSASKFVVVRNADEFLSKFREQLENYVAQPSDSSTLILRLESLPSNHRIYKAIGRLRRLLGDDQHAPRYLTQLGRSYVLNLPARGDIRKLSRQIAILTNEVRELAAEVDEIRRPMPKRPANRPNRSAAADA